MEGKIKAILFDLYGTLFISKSGDISMAKKESPQTEKLEKLLYNFGIQKEPQTVLKQFFTAIENQHELLKDRKSVV